MSSQTEYPGRGLPSRALLATFGCLVTLGVILILGVLVSTSMICVDLPINQITATMTLRPTVNDGVVRAAASTDLPDGARIFYYFYHERNDVEWTGGLPPYNVQGYTEVEDGSFSFEGDRRRGHPVPYKSGRSSMSTKASSQPTSLNSSARTANGLAVRRRRTRI